MTSKATRTDIEVTCNKCREDFKIIIYEDQYGRYLCCPHCNNLYDINTK